LIVLVTSGACDIEACYRGGWQSTHDQPGHIGMTAPGEAVALRWHGDTPHSNLQLRLPEATVHRVMQELSDRASAATTAACA
jgi:hypothetical protein